MNIAEKYRPSVSKIFSPLVMNNLSLTGHSDYLTELCKNSLIIKQINSKLTLAQFFDIIYDFLYRRYRTEYIYKNVIANKILIGRHSLNTAKMLTEFRVGKCKADVIVLNGTSTVYEIKSEYDNFSRLNVQIKSYLEVFDFINVITTSSQANKICNLIPNNVGVLILTDKNTISTFREAISNKENVNPEILFDSLRKDEYLAVIKEFYNKIPQVPNTLIHTECKKLFSKIPATKAHNMAMYQISKRMQTDLIKDFLLKAPSSLTAYAMNASSSRKIIGLLKYLNNEFHSVLN
jgi:hypothetical protein